MGSHPLLLAAIVVYIVAASSGLSNFPPVRIPNHIDVFRLYVLLFLVMRIAVTYKVSAALLEVTPALFAMELMTALLLAWQLRLLAAADAVPELRQGPWLSAFYGAEIMLMGSLYVGNWLASTQFPTVGNPLRYVGIRLLTVAISLAGCGIELVPTVPDGFRRCTRWAIALSFFSMSVLYLFSNPLKSIRSGP